MGVSYRNIERKDNKELAELIRSVFREFGVDRPGTVYFDPTTDDLFTLFRTPGSVYWVAEDDGKIIGGCGIFPTQNLPEGCAELVKFYLDATYRKRGIGRRLMEMSLESAKEMGYTQIYLESLPELGKAISLYKKQGFRFIDHKMGDEGHFGCTIWMLKELW
jgi:putative acetyltransferase